jgi:thiamine-phosphate pyrophosphorylase
VTCGERPRLDLSLYLITDRSLCGARGVSDVVAQAVAGGVTLVQLRDPEAKTGALIELGRALIALLEPTGVPLIVNDRVDVALAIGAAGVHIGQADMTAQDARALLGPERLLGLSVGTLDELAESELSQVDYLGVGPVFATRTKPDAGAAIGVEGLRAIAARTHLPLAAIGGIGPSNAAEVLAAGAAGLAVVSAICAAPDPKLVAAELAEIVRGAARRPRS